MQKKIKKIYALPNIFTSMNIFCGFYAIISAVDSRFVHASIAILIGGVFDLLDGKIARATKTTSRFGIEYDSLADLVSFGVAPALLMFFWALKPLGRLGWLGGFLFMVCGALRLARFNITNTSNTSSNDSNNFQGLPIPAAAGMNVSIVLFFSRLNINPESYKIFILIMLYILSFLMVSSINYKSFKNAGLFKSMKFNKLVGAILIFVSMASEPYIALFGLSSFYIISGPFLSFLAYRKNKKEIKINIANNK